MVNAAARAARNARELSGCSATITASTLIAATVRPTPSHTSRTAGRRAVMPAGRSAVSVVSSAMDKAADAVATRSSCSSSVSRPCASAALRGAITLPRATLTYRGSSAAAPAASSSPGCVVTSASRAAGPRGDHHEQPDRPENEVDDRGHDDHGRLAGVWSLDGEQREDAGHEYRVFDPQDDLRRPPRIARAPGLGALSGDIRGDLGQFRVCPGRVHLARPLAELIAGQPAVHERGLKGADHLLAVGVGRAEAATAAGPRGRRPGIRYTGLRSC